MSGGERQRICLARAIIREPSLLLLDEATSALDNISERLIQRALKEMKQRCSVVVVAHRSSTVKLADQVLVLDKGELVQQGAHTELAEQSGLFARLSGADGADHDLLDE